MIRIKWFGKSRWEIRDENTGNSADPFVCIKDEVPDNRAYHSLTDIQDTEIMSNEIDLQKSNTVILNYV